MNRKYVRIGSILLLVMFVLGLVSPVLAAFGDETGMVPDFKTAWGGLSPYVQGKIKWVIGIALVLAFAIAILFTVGGGAGALFSQHRGDVGGRSTGMANSLKGVAFIFLMIIGIAVISYLAISA